MGDRARAGGQWPHEWGPLHIPQALARVYGCISLTKQPLAYPKYASHYYNKSASLNREDNYIKQTHGSPLSYRLNLLTS